MKLWKESRQESIMQNLELQYLLWITYNNNIIHLCALESKNSKTEISNDWHEETTKEWGNSIIIYPRYSWIRPNENVG